MKTAVWFSTLALAASLPAQTIALARTGGTLGKPVTVTVTGTQAQAFLMLPSLNAGPTPLSLLDPKDPRSLEAGLDLLPLAFAGVLGGAPLKVGYPIPNVASLSGQTLHFQAFLFPGKTYVAGNLSNPIRQTLGAGNTWVNRGTVLAEARALAGVSPLAGGRYLLSGGGSGNLLSSRGLATSELYDADRQRFTKGPNLITARALHGAVTLKDGRVLIVGGVDTLGNPLRSCEIYDPKTSSFKTTGSLRIARAGHTTDLLPNGRVLVTGGTSNFTDALNAINATERSTEIYNPATGTWSNGPNMSVPRLVHASIALSNGNILLTGGATWTLLFIIKIPGITNSCEIYNPSSNSFSSTGSMPSSRAGHVLTRLANGDVLVSGGASFQSITNISIISNAATYNVSAGKWTPTANTMTIARAGQATALLPDNRVLIIGGATGSLTTPGSTARCDFYDPSTRRFSPAPALSVARAGAHALMLPEGQVFVAGGGGGTNNVALSSGEMYFIR